MPVAIEITIEDMKNYIAQPSEFRLVPQDGGVKIFARAEGIDFLLIRYREGKPLRVWSVQDAIEELQRLTGRQREDLLALIEETRTSKKSPSSVSRDRMGASVGKRNHSFLGDQI